MLTSIIALLFLMLSAFTMAMLLRRRIEECIPVSFTAIICTLTAFYCIGLIRIGMVLVCAVIMAGCAFAMLKRKSVADFASVLFTPGSIIYLMLCLIYILFLSNNLVSRHDELRLWGAVPKAIHATGNLQLGWESPVFSIMQSYPPGEPMLSYFFTAFSSAFSEGALYTAYACASVSFFIPAFSKWDWKDKRLIAPAGLLVFLTPMVFTSHFGDGGLFGMTLFVDPLLGILAGYCFYLAGQNPLRSRTDLVFFSLALSAVCLLKSTGVLFAFAALCCAVAVDGFQHKNRWIIPFFAVLAGFGLWKFLLKLHDVHELVPLKMHCLSKTAVRNVAHALISENMIAYKVPLGFLLSFAFLFFLLAAAYLIIGFTKKEQKPKKYYIISGAFVVSTILFIYGYSLIYGETLESFPRYMAAPLLAVMTCILLSFLPMCHGGKALEWIEKRKASAVWLISAFCIVFGISVFYVWCMIFPPLAATKTLDLEAEQIRTAVQKDPERSGTGWIYLVMAGDGIENSHFHHRIYFDLISEDINIRNGFAQTQVVVPGLENPAESWAEDLRSGYEYVYIYSLEEDFKQLFADFSDEVPQEKALYRVIKSDTDYGIKLKSV